jgi:hypothetical protein
MTEIKSNAVNHRCRLISAALLGCEGRLNPNSEAGMGERTRPACAFGRRARTLVNTLDALSKSPPAEGSGPANAILAQIPVGRVPSRGIGLGFESYPTIPGISGAKKFAGRGFRRDAENHPPEACAPRNAPARPSSISEFGLNSDCGGHRAWFMLIQLFFT